MVSTAVLTTSTGDWHKGLEGWVEDCAGGLRGDWIDSGDARGDAEEGEEARVAAVPSLGGPAGSIVIVIRVVAVTCTTCRGRGTVRRDLRVSGNGIALPCQSCQSRVVSCLPLRPPAAGDVD